MSDAIELETFRELQQTAGADFVVELVGAFLEEGPSMLRELRAAHSAAAAGTAGAAETFRRAAHSLKSNAQTFGAVTLAAMARELELGGIDVEPEALGAVDAEYARVAGRLAELCRE
jgi:HPt (histidine-containing phosphotransfer) domain-containing protein